MENVIIVGTGCAGLTAAIYAARASFAPLVLEGIQPGGQLSTTTLVENFPGFVDGIDGPDLINIMKAQAEKFGARFEYSSVNAVEKHEGFLRLTLDERSIDTKTLIIATGASAKHLGLPGERELVGRGLTSCATCDGAFYRNVPVCVIGGGDSACEEAGFLTRFASKVYLIHRRDSLRASKVMADRAMANPKIEPIWNSTVSEYLTNDKKEMRAIRVKNLITGEESEVDVACVFVAIGHVPNTAPFKGLLDMDDNGYLKHTHGTATNVPGIFAAGDVADPVYRQAITAAGEGCAAALDAERYLAHLE